MARDYTEVYRVAHELQSRHGWSAHEYAAKLVAEALAEGLTEDAEFWKAVESTLTPRGGSEPHGLETQI